MFVLIRVDQELMCPIQFPFLMVYLDQFTASPCCHFFFTVFDECKIHVDRRIRGFSICSWPRPPPPQKKGKLKKLTVHKFKNARQARTGRNMVKSSSPNAPST